MEQGVKKRVDTNRTIVKKHLIICEGADEKNFLIPYLNSEALSDVPAFSNDFQVMDFGGNSDLSAHLQLLQNADNFETVDSLLIIRDAEQDARKAVSEVQSALRKTGFPIPQSPCLWEGESPKVGFLLFPAFTCDPKDGTLEDMCLSILAEPQSSEILKEIDGFMARLSKNCQRNFNRPFKTRLHTYFSVHNNYVSLKVGEAAKAGAFDWNSAALEPLRNFLLEVV